MTRCRSSFLHARRLAIHEGTPAAAARRRDAKGWRRQRTWRPTVTHRPGPARLALSGAMRLAAWSSVANNSQFTVDVSHDNAAVLSLVVRRLTDDDADDDGACSLRPTDRDTRKRQEGRKEGGSPSDRPVAVQDKPTGVPFGSSNISSFLSKVFVS